MAKMARPLAELRTLPSGQLIAEHDEAAARSEANVNYYLAELALRDQARQTRAMLGYTKTMARYTNTIKWLTWVVAGATIVNVLVTIALYVRG